MESRNTKEKYITARQLRLNGEYYKARRALSQGKLVKVRHGVYALPDAIVSNMADVEALIPNSVVCMYSAWSYHKLTTTVAPAICVAVTASRKVSPPDLIPFQIYYWKEKYLTLGVTECEYSGFRVKITDIEKSVCDALRYRNKIGIDLCTEILTTYLARTDRNLSRLTQYAKTLRVARSLSNYLDIYVQ